MTVQKEQADVDIIPEEELIQIENEAKSGLCSLFAKWETTIPHLVLRLVSEIRWWRADNAVLKEEIRRRNEVPPVGSLWLGNGVLLEVVKLDWDEEMKNHRVWFWDNEVRVVRWLWQENWKSLVE